MLTTHLELMSLVLARADARRPRRAVSALRAVARLVRAGAARVHRARVNRYPPLSDHLRRDIGLDPLPRDIFRS